MEVEVAFVLVVLFIERTWRLARCLYICCCCCVVIVGAYVFVVAVVVVVVVDIIVLTNFLLECTIRTWRLGQLGTNSSFLWLPGLVLQSKYDQNSTWGTLRLQNHLLQLGFLFTFLWSRDNSI